MGTINLKGKSPFEVPPPTDATAFALHGSVVLTLTATADAPDPVDVQIRTLRSIELAEKIKSQIQAALPTARIQLTGL
jgi:hypothetical protein